MKITLKQRAIAYGLAIAAFVVLSGLLLTGQVSHNAHTLKEQKVLVRSICMAQNEQNAKEVRLWEFVIQLSASSPRTNETDAQKAKDRDQLAKFRAFLADTFKQQECS